MHGARGALGGVVMGGESKDAQKRRLRKGVGRAELGIGRRRGGPGLTVGGGGVCACGFGRRQASMCS